MKLVISLVANDLCLRWGGLYTGRGYGGGGEREKHLGQIDDWENISGKNMLLMKTIICGILLH